MNCISVQDTDVDDVMPEYFCSAVATCMDNKTEVLELFGNFNCVFIKCIHAKIASFLSMHDY